MKVTLRPPARLALAMIVLLAVFPGCALLRGKTDSETPPETAQETGNSGNAGHYETVVLFATGNIRGALLEMRPGSGGAALLEAYFKEARRDFGERTVWLDAGDLRGKSLDDGFDGGASFENFLKTSGMAVTLAGPSRTSAPAPAPAIDQDTGRVLLTGGQLTAAQEPVHGSAPTFVQAGHLKLGIVSAGSSQELLAQSSSARSQGAQLVVWLSDLPIRCNPSPVVEHASSLRRPGSPNGFCEGAIHDIIADLPEGTVNAVIATGDGRTLERFIYPRYSSDPVAGVPVVAASPFGASFHLIYLSYDPRTEHAVLTRTRIEGPIPVERGQFHGHDVAPDRDTLEQIRPAQDWVATQEKSVLATSSVVLSGKSDRESGLGDLVADALREETKSDFAIVPPGLTKHAVDTAALPSGPVSRIELERALPQDAPVFVIPVTGEELKTLVRVSENGSRGFSAVSGMKLRLIRPDRDAPATDLDGDHRLSLWERNRLLEISDPGDEPIQAGKTYRLAVPRYLVYGGDDWQWVSHSFGLAERAARQQNGADYPSTRELVAQYLKHLGKIDEVPARIKFENPPGKGRHRARRRRHRSRKHRHL